MAQFSNFNFLKLNSQKKRNFVGKYVIKTAMPNRSHFKNQLKV